MGMQTENSSLPTDSSYPGGGNIIWISALIKVTHGSLYCVGDRPIKGGKGIKDTGLET